MKDVNSKDESIEMRVNAMKRIKSSTGKSKQLVLLLVFLLVMLPVAALAKPIIHNSTTLGSNKWAGDGGWGVSGGKYGKAI